VVVVSYSGKEINAKLVYYGAGLSGKTTNLEAIYEAVPETSRGKMVSMKTQSDRTLFFDLLPLDLGEIMGFKTRFLLYTVPGQVFYNATRKLVLKGADAIVFVADSGVGKMDENVESLQNLRQNLTDYGLRLDDVPWVLQYNKRDLPNVYSVDELNASLNPGGRVPVFESVASQGGGVFETFRGISHLLMQKVTRELHRSPQGGARTTRGAVTRGAQPVEPTAAEFPAIAQPHAPAAPAPQRAAVPAAMPAAPEPAAFADPASIGRDPFASPAAPAPEAADEAPIADTADADDVADAPAFEIERGTPPPPGALAAAPSDTEREDSSRSAMFDDEPAGLQPPASPARASRTASPFEERTLALVEPSGAARRDDAVVVDAPVTSAREIAIPITVPAGETREIVLRITIRPAA